MAEETHKRKEDLDENQNVIDNNQALGEKGDTFNWVELYGEIWTNIRETDQISFKLLGSVPLVSGSGAGLLVFLLDRQDLSFIPVICLSLLSIVVTFGLYRWERRNIQTCNRLIKRAALLEKRFGFGNLAGKEEAPTILGHKFGKTQAEQIIYSASIVLWLVPIIVAFNQS